MDKYDEDVLDIRFESEQCALDLTYQLYLLFLNKDIPDTVPSLGDIQKRLIELIDILYKNKEADEVRIKTERTMLTNVFFTALLRKFKKKEALGYEKQLRRLLPRFDKNLATESTTQIQVPPISLRVKTIHLVATWFFSEGEKSKEAIKQLCDILTDIEIKEAIVLPYDQKRFKFLKEIIKQEP